MKINNFEKEIKIIKDLQSIHYFNEKNERVEIESDFNIDENIEELLLKKDLSSLKGKNIQ